ncbi:MAG TPA: POTRA domain-containing protein [Bacteroidia bacterium]|nr:POTRA domain-containing protein [Bacteroidia bacterium]HQF27320.1 POTRA domain-containing protein [Bacteroidia bacterium]HQK97178.1 POTRA domain-containing protein [Bacteroidia bacterium]
MVKHLQLSFFLFFVLSSALSFGQNYRDSLVNSESIIDRIIITGNNKTKEHIITRELLFHEGDTLPKYVLETSIEKSRENLMNIGLFNFVDIKYFQGIGEHTDVHIQVTERWYLWPMPIFEIADRNFNEWFSKKDLSRTNYGMYVRQENFRGRDEILQVQFLLGYSQRLGLAYTIPYINRKQNLGFTAGVFTTRNHEIAYNTYQNKLLFYKDPDRYVRRDLSAFVRVTKRNGLYQYFNTTFEYKKVSTVDTVLEMNNDFFIDGKTQQQYLSIGWNFRLDKRDYQAYAQRGYLFEADIYKTGFGLLKNEPHLIGLSLAFRKYQPIAQRFNISGMVKGRVVQRDDAPYSNQRALGYGNDYIRGYDYYVMNGQNFALFRSNFKYTLMPTKVYKAPIIRSDKFRLIPVSMYLNAFFDAGYVSDRQYAEFNPLNNSWQYSYGIGYDYVTYYDLVFRFEFAINRLNESGLFFHIGTSF